MAIEYTFCYFSFFALLSLSFHRWNIRVIARSCHPCQQTLKASIASGKFSADSPSPNAGETLRQTTPATTSRPPILYLAVPF